MSDEIHELEVDPDWDPFGVVAKGNENIRHLWVEDRFIRISDCPLCIVCDGARVWKGWPCTTRLGTHWQPCMICGGRGRMPFVAPSDDPR